MLLLVKPFVTTRAQCKINLTRFYPPPPRPTPKSRKFGTRSLNSQQQQRAVVLSKCPPPFPHSCKTLYSTRRYIYLG